MWEFSRDNIHETELGTDRQPAKLAIIRHDPMRWLLILFAALLVPVVPKDQRGPAAQNPTTAVHPIQFEEIAEKAGLHFVTVNGNAENKNQQQTMVAGIALFDFDNDG